MKLLNYIDNSIITHLVNYWIAYILMILSLLATIAFSTLSERKFMGSIQRRKGPDVVGFWGILQAIADGVKLVLKEIILPYKVSMVLFLFGPSLVFFLSLCGWIVIPLSDISFASTINVSLLFVFVCSGFNIYGLVLSGWSSNSRYAFLGGIRATAQMISYELVFGLINLFIFFFAGSFNLTDIVKAQSHFWFILPLLPVFIAFLVVMLAETNRTPFDLAEAEAELVAGYNVEYSSITFALFFLGEYSNMIFLSFVGTIYFFGGWSMPFITFTIPGVSETIFIVKILFFFMFFIWIRATLPRYRYDQLMELAWKVLLPLLFSFFLLCMTIAQFWKDWVFLGLTIILAVINFIHTLFLIFDKIEILKITPYANITANNCAIAIYQNLYLKQFPLTVLTDPIREGLQNLHKFYVENVSYNYFFKTTNITLFNQEIRQYIPKEFEDPIRDSIESKGFFWQVNNTFILQFFSFYSDKTELFNRLFRDTYDAIIQIIVLNKEIAALEDQLDRFSKYYGYFSREKLMYSDIIHKNLIFKYLNIKRLNTEIQQYVVSINLIEFDEELIAKYIESKKTDQDKMYTIYLFAEEKHIALNIKKEKLIYKIFVNLRPLYGPFWLIYNFMDAASDQIAQIFPYNLKKVYLNTNIIQNQMLINSKYI